MAFHDISILLHENTSVLHVYLNLLLQHVFKKNQTQKSMFFYVGAVVHC